MVDKYVQIDYTVFSIKNQGKDMTNQSYSTVEELIKDLCDGDKNLPSREAITVQEVQAHLERTQHNTSKPALN